MKLIKTYESFSNSDITSICDEFGIKNYTINEDSSINVDGDVNLSNKKLTKLPLKFGNVNGHFYCHDNELTSLVGSPENVGGYFYCNNNKLRSLEGCPTSVGRGFYCYGNQIRDLDGLENVIFSKIFFEGNPVNEIWKLFEDKTHLEFFNDCDIVRDDSIVLDRLNFFLEEIGKEPVKEIKGYKVI